MSPALLLALHLPAAAFAPGGSTSQGLEPQRLQVAHPAVQAALDRTPEWRAFVAAEGPGWDVVWDEVTRTPRRVRGPGVPVPDHDPAALSGAVLDWITLHADLLGVEPGALRVRDARHVARTDTWYVDVDALVDGTTVWRGGLTARVKRGRLVDLGASTYPRQPITGAWTLPAGAAKRVAIGDGPAPGAEHTDLRADRRLLPLTTLDGLELRRVWMVRSRTASPPGRWVAFVDASTGSLLSVHDEVRWFDGQVLGEHDVRSPLDGLTVSPMPLVEVESGGAVATAALDGWFSVAGSDDLVTDLHGAYARVHNDAGDDAVLAGPGPDLLWTEADATQAEIDAYVFLHHARAWGEALAPEVAMVEGPVDAHVNIDDTCNAYFDGAVNFYRAGQSCNNTARIADVVYHEWGHGFHLWSLESTWIGFDGSLSEGAADTVAFLMTDDHRVAPGFFVSGDPIRDVDNAARYPEDFVAHGAWVHSNGLIFGGAMWDLREILAETLGEAQATDTTARLFADALKGGPDIPTSYDEVLLADDDNGDLADGTPHECAIIEAFGAHGLGPLGQGGPYVAWHEPPVPVADAPQPLRWELESVAPACVPFDPVAATLHYRVDDGDWQSAPARIAATAVEAVVPAQPLGTFVAYWLEVEDGSGATFTAPRGGAVSPYSLYAGGVLEVWCHDFEEDDGGFKHRLVDGGGGEGADDWQWGSPAGRSGDPSAAWSGDKVWGNDLGHDAYNGAYQDGKHNRLRSPVLDLLHYDGPFLHYRRWLGVEDGVYDAAWIEADDEVIWTNHATDGDHGDAHHLDDGWMAHAVPLGRAADDREVRLAWHLQSDGGLTFGGWTIDDVCLLAPDTRDNRLGVGDFEAIDAGGATLLSWTNPRHEPLAEVVVVRSFDGWPAGPHDGEVVYRDTAPEPGALVQRGDVVGAGYLAVYASDGAEWLSWTRPGLNAALVGGEPTGPDRARGAGGAGCACASGGAPPLGAWTALLLAFGVGARRLRDRS